MFHHNHPSFIEDITKKNPFGLFFSAHTVVGYFVFYRLLRFVPVTKTMNGLLFMMINGVSESGRRDCTTVVDYIIVTAEN